MKFDKQEADAIVEKCFSRHNIGGNKRNAEEHVAQRLLDGNLSLGDLSELFISTYRAFHPKLITMNLDNGV